jgi:hypothetical protein
MDISQGKVFFKPEAGTYLGTIIDVVDKPQVQTTYGLKNKVLILWVITQLNGAPYLDPEGLPYQVSIYTTASMSEKSSQPLFRNLYKVVSGVLNGQQPPLITSTAQLEQVLLGRSNVLMVTKEAVPGKQNEFYVNPVGILPMQTGMPIPQAPAGFVRSKNKPKTQAGPQGVPVQTYTQPQQFVPPPQNQNTVSLSVPPATPEAF